MSKRVRPSINGACFGVAHIELIDAHEAFRKAKEEACDREREMYELAQEIEAGLDIAESDAVHRAAERSALRNFLHQIEEELRTSSRAPATAGVGRH